MIFLITKLITLFVCAVLVTSPIAIFGGIQTLAGANERGLMQSICHTSGSLSDPAGTVGDYYPPSALSQGEPGQPIRINSNADFNQVNGVANWDTGNGTEANPWIIEDWDIDGTDYGCCIYIGNTTEHFIVRNCTLHDASGEYSWPDYPGAGLELMNVENCTVENNLAYGNSCDGISLSYSRHNRILNNTARNNQLR